MSGSPAFQLYVNDFLGSAKVGMMNGQEIGIYTMLLFLDWQEGGFELVQKPLSVWCRVTLEDFERAWPLVGQCFKKRRGRMYSPRLQLEREKQAAWREKSAKGGVKSGEARSKGGSRMVEPLSNTPSPLPLPITTTTKAIPGKPVSWPGEAAEVWKAVAPIPIPRLGKALKPVVDEYGWPDTKAALECYVSLNQGKTRKVEWFAGDVVRWLALSKMPCVDPITRELTEKGRMA